MKVTPAGGTGARNGECFAGCLKAQPGACVVEGMAVVVQTGCGGQSGTVNAGIRVDPLTSASWQ